MTLAPVYLSGEEIARLRKKGKKVVLRRRGERGGGGPRGRGESPGKYVEPKVNLSKVKIFPLGVQTSVAAGATETTWVQTAQNPFEPIRGIAQASISLDDIEFTQLDCGNVSQLVVKNARFPGQMLSPQADDVLCDLDIVPGGIQFSMQGFNQNVANQRVTIGFFGNYFMNVSLRG